MTNQPQPSIDEILRTLHWSHFDTIDGTDGCEKPIAEASAQLQQLIEWVIGEDVPTPRPKPDFLIGDVYGVEENELRAEQRKRLTSIMKG